MSDETQSQDIEAGPPEISSVPVKKAAPNPTVQLAGVVVAAILAFALLVWAQGIRLAGARRDSFGRGVDGIAAALTIPVIETGSRVNPNRGARLQTIVDSIQRTARFQTVIVTDPNGNVLAATDTSLQGQTVKEMADAKSTLDLKESDGVIEATRSIDSEGGDKLGALKIKVKL